MTTQPVFNVRPFGNCLQLVPIPTPPICIEQSEICIQQLQNFLNATRPIDNGGCITSDINFRAAIYFGDDDNFVGFLDPALDYRTQFLLNLFPTSVITPPPFVTINLQQVGIIQRIVSGGAGTITEEELTCIINSIPSTFNRCQNRDSLTSQQIEARARALISTTDQVEIFSENGGPQPVFIKDAKPGIIIATDAGTGPYLSVSAFSTCFVAALTSS